jgi:hypothetical protein
MFPRGFPWSINIIARGNTGTHTVLSADFARNNFAGFITNIKIL